MNFGLIFGGFAAAGMLVVGTTGGASALSMRLSDASGASITLGENSGIRGFLAYDGEPGGPFAGWTGLSAEATACGVDCARMDARFAADAAPSDGWLVLEVTQTDLTFTPATWSGRFDIGGSPEGGALIEAFWDQDNAAFARTNLAGSWSQEALDTGAASFASGLDEVERDGPFSMTTVITFNLADVVSTPGDEMPGEVAAVPLPAALPLLGAAAAMLGFAGHRRRRD